MSVKFHVFSHKSLQQVSVGYHQTLLTDVHDNSTSGSPLERKKNKPPIVFDYERVFHFNVYT